MLYIIFILISHKKYMKNWKIEKKALSISYPGKVIHIHNQKWPTEEQHQVLKEFEGASRCPLRQQDEVVQKTITLWLSEPGVHVIYVGSEIVLILMITWVYHLIKDMDGSLSLSHQCL